MTEREAIIKEHAAAIADQAKALDSTFMGEMTGVAQAIGQLREQLDALDILLSERQFFKASQLGYDRIASAFIFLQRTLAGLQDAQHKLEALIQDTGLATGLSDIRYEEVAPFIEVRPRFLTLGPHLL